MTSAVDYRDVLRQVCSAAEVEIDPHTGEAIERLHAERLEAKARPLTEVATAYSNRFGSSGQQGSSWASSATAPSRKSRPGRQAHSRTFSTTSTFSYKVGIAKPEPAIYLSACSKPGVKPEQVAFVGDGGSDEITGARHAGLTPYWARWFLDQWPPQLAADSRRPPSRLPDPHKAT